ncbi:DUF2274 domain-containing protein [Mesorhizobium ventifaucium]|nr:DUF2274 domain-containing protein [Mesorhizobium ventifaucium]
MVERFMATVRAFSRRRGGTGNPS